MKKALLVAGVILAVFAAVIFCCLPAAVDRMVNAGFAKPPYDVMPKAAALHSTLFVADMHNDSLMWNRDFLARNTRGFLDLPRMVEGNIALQNFMVVSKSPRWLNIELNDDTTDDITILAVIEMWPVASWFSLKERALYQAGKLHEFAARSNGKFQIIKTSEQLAQFRERRLAERDLAAGVLGIEGTQVLEGDPGNIDAMFDAGFRVVGLTHFFDNDMAGSVHGMTKGGLSEKGREMLRLAEQKKMIVDIAHSSAATIDDVLAQATRPVIVSHTGVKATMDNNRNLSDEQLRRIAGRGGLIGIGFWEEAAGPVDSLDGVVKAIRHTVSVVGIDAVGIGSDSDGFTAMPMDSTGMVLLTDALMKDGFSDIEIRKIMGENQAAFYLKMLP